MAQATGSFSRRNHSLGTLHPNSYGRGPNSNSGARFGRVAAKGFSETVVLNKSITAMAEGLANEKNWDKWERLCQNNLGKFDLVNCVTAIYSAAVKVQDQDKPRFVRRYDRVVKDLLEKISSGISSGASRNLSNTINALAKLNIKDDDLIQKISRRAQSIIGTFNAQGCSNTAWAFATLRIKDNELFNAISDRARCLIETFNAQGCSNIASAFAITEINAPKLFDALSVRSQTIIGTFDAQGGASLLWAFGEARIVDVDLFQKMFKQLKIEDLKYIEIDQVLRTIARLKVIEDRAFIAKIIEEVQKKKSEMGSYLSFCCWSLAVIFNLYDLSGQGPTPKELEILNEFLRELDEIKFQMNQKGEDFKEENKKQLTSVLLYLKHFHPESYKPKDYDHIRFMVDAYSYFREMGHDRPQSSITHRQIHQKLEKLLKRDLLIEQFHAGYYLDTVVDEKSKVALEVVGLYHELSSGGMMGEDILRAQILKKEGWNVLEVSVKKWRESSDSEKDQYLLDLLPKELSSSSSDSSDSEDTDMSSDDDSKAVSKKRRRGEAGLEPLSPVSADKKGRA